MPWTDTERTDIYLGDIFFKSFVGIFDQENNSLALAKSSRAANSDSITYSCSGDYCIDPTANPDPSPDPDPEPEPGKRSIENLHMCIRSRVQL